MSVHFVIRSAHFIRQAVKGGSTSSHQLLQRGDDEGEEKSSRFVRFREFDEMIVCFFFRLIRCEYKLIRVAVNEKVTTSVPLPS